MIRLLLVSSDMNSLSDFVKFFEKQPDVSVLSAESGTKALDLISTEKLDLVISDEDLQDMTCFAFVEKLVMANPMINCALLGTMDPDDFHETTEGMGVLMQLSPTADEEQLEKLLIQVRKINDFMGDSNR